METIKTKTKNLIKGFFPGHEPDFLIVGAQKAATTSLHYYLNQHPNLIGSRPKEVCFFDRDANFSKGLTWYKRNFPNTKNPFKQGYKYFESTPEYLYRSYVPLRIKNYNPSVKIIISLRDPVERAFSAWSMYKAFKERGSIPAVITEGYIGNQANNLFNEFYADQFPSFEEAIASEIKKITAASDLDEPGIIRRGIYFKQVKNYLDLFGKQNVLIIGFKDLIGSNKKQTLNSILTFVDIPESNWSFLVDEMKNVGKKKDEIAIETKAFLNSFYAPYNQQLFDLIGFKPNW